MFESMETAAATFVLCATIWLALGLGLAQLLRKQPARAHGILVAALACTLVTPFFYLVIQQANWGLLPSTGASSPSLETIRENQTQGTVAPEPMPLLPNVVARMDAVVEPFKENGPVELGNGTSELADRFVPVQEIPEQIAELEPDLPIPPRLSWRDLALWGWFGATMLMLLRLSLDFLAGYRVAKKSQPVSDAQTARDLALQAQKVGLNAAPVLARSESIASPVLWGWSRPARILIAALAGANANGRGVYLHELAHLARRDHLTTLIGEIVWCLIPWHPLAWWARRALEARSEEACDDWAIACGCQAADYADELVQLAPSRAGVLTMAAVSKNSRLKSRISRLLQGAFSSPRLERRWVIGVGLAALLFTGFLSILQPRIAQAGSGETESEQAATEPLQDLQTTPSSTNATEIVVMAEGKPVEGARVWVMAGYDEAGEAIMPGPQKSDAKGRTIFPVDPAKVEVAYALDQQGRLAVKPIQRRSEEMPDFRLFLQKTQAIEAALTHLGKPVARVNLEATSFNFLEATTGSVPYPPGFPERVVQSDEMGRVRFSHLPPQCGLLCLLADSRFARGGVYLDPGSPKKVELVEAGSLRYTLEGAKELADPNAVNWVLIPKNQENKTFLFQRFSDSQFKKNASSSKNLVTHLAPGEYTFTFSPGGTVPYTFGDPQTVLIEKGKTTNVAVPVKQAALIKGRLVDSESGEGIPNLRFNLQSTHNSDSKREFVWAQTDEKGFYQVYVRGKGHYGIVFLGNGADADRYQPPPYDAKTRSNGVHGEVGEGTSVTFPDMAMTRAALIRGKIENQTTPGAKEGIQVYCPLHGSKSPGGMADARVQDGAMELRGIPQGIPLSVRIRQGKAVNIPESLTPDQWAEVPKLQLSEANGVTFVGMVQNQLGKPVAKARVKLFWNYPLQGRDSKLSTSKLMEVAHTDEKGQFRCVGYWPQDRFYLGVECDGYQPAGGDFNATKKGGPGETVDFGTFRLTRTSASVQGKVVGLDGAPIRGLVVRAAGEAERAPEIQSDDKGRFQIDQLPEGPGILLVRGSGFRSTYAPFLTDDKERTIVVRRLTDPPPSYPVIADAYLASRKKMISHMLESLWKTRAENGYGRLTFESMNQFDPARAREWVNQVSPQEKMRWENAMALSLTDDQVFKITKENVEDGIAAIRRSGRNPSREFSGLGEKFVKENKEIAIRLAEEAALSARQYDPNETTWKALSLAEAGELAWKAGNQAGGRKLIEEAIASLKKNPQHRLYEVSCGGVAASLAIIDWPEAKKLLDLCSDPSYFNSGLSACIKKIVVINPDDAIKKIDLIKEDRSFAKSLLTISLARTIAPQDFSRAIGLVERLKGESFYVQGLVELALKIPSADRRTAHKLIDQAFDYLDLHESAFRTWSNYGGRPVLAAQIVYFAKKINYPDLNSLIARSLGYLDEQRKEDPRSRKQQGLLTAFALAFTDPVTAKELAQMHSSLDAVAKDWSQGGRRGGGFLLALIDPERALASFDSLAAAGWNSQKTSQAGLSELLGSFTQPGDLMENMTRWEGLMWQSLERD